MCGAVRDPGRDCSFDGADLRAVLPQDTIRNRRRIDCGAWDRAGACDGLLQGASRGLNGKCDDARWRKTRNSLFPEALRNHARFRQGCLLRRYRRLFWPDLKHASRAPGRQQQLRRKWFGLAFDGVLACRVCEVYSLACPAGRDIARHRTLLGLASEAFGHRRGNGVDEFPYFLNLILAPGLHQVTRGRL